MAMYVKRRVKRGQGGLSLRGQETDFKPQYRVSLSGTNIMYRGSPIYLQGNNYGHNGYYTNRDPFEDVAFGCNSARIPYRGWGDYPSGIIADGELVGAPGNLDPGYWFNTIFPQIYGMKKAGGITLVGRDSNCGINGKTGLTQCTLGGTPDQHYWSPGALAIAKRAQCVATWRYVARNWGKPGWIDIYEPAIEPANQAAGVSTSDIQDLQEEFMDAILLEDPAAIFMLGGRAYGTGNMLLMYRDSWATKYPNKIVGTGNLLSNAMAEDDASFAARIQLFNDLRTARNIPVASQQVGIESAADVNFALTTRGLRACKANNIHRWWWEKTTDIEDSFGEFWMSGTTRVKKPLYDVIRGLYNE